MDASQRISIRPKTVVWPAKTMTRALQNIRPRPPMQQKPQKKDKPPGQKNLTLFTNMAKTDFLSNLQKSTGLSITLPTTTAAALTSTVHHQPVVNYVSLSMPVISETIIHPVVVHQQGITNLHVVSTSGDNDVRNPPVTTPSLLQSESVVSTSNPVALRGSVASSDQVLQDRENRSLLAMQETLARFGEEELWETYVDLETRFNVCVKRVKELRSQERKLEEQVARAQNKAKGEGELLTKIMAQRDLVKARMKETEGLIARLDADANMEKLMNEAQIANCEAVVKQCQLEMSLLENPEDKNIKEELQKAIERTAATDKHYRALQENRVAMSKRGAKDVNDLKRKILKDKKLLWRCEGEIGKMSDAKKRREKDREKRETKLRNAKEHMKETSTRIAALKRELVRHQVKMIQTIWMRKLEVAEAHGMDEDVIPKVSWANAADVLGFANVLVTDAEVSPGSKPPSPPSTSDGTTDQSAAAASSEATALSRPVSPCLSSSSLDGPLTTDAQALLVSSPEISDDSDMELMIVEEQTSLPNSVAVTEVEADTKV